nr:FAD-binding oxidoreductase [candidate division Zixibacteria bacterium]
MEYNGYLKNKATLTAYASDGSLYAITPDRVRLVDSAEAVQKVLTDAPASGLSVTCRGGGTGLTGGAVGSGIILDFSGYRDILKIDTASKTVHTQVGIIYDDLNQILKESRLFFPPDPSSGDSCQIGGMLANNSSGPRSIKYGLTSDFVEEIEIINASGKLLNLKKLKINGPEFSGFIGNHGEYGRVYDLLDKNRDIIRQNWPRVKKNSAGYNLFQVVKDIERGIFNLPALLVGSEGTLAIILSARLRLLPLADKRLTARLYFKSLVEAGRAVPDILAAEPAGLEIVDGATLNLIGRDRFGIPESAAAMLLVEFDDNLEEKRAKFLELVSAIDLAGPVEFASDPEAAAALWRVRKAIVPTLYRHHPTRRPISLVEDVSLPPEHIPLFIEYVTGLFSKHNRIFGIFGHIGDGNLHLRPLFDLNDPDDFKLAGLIYEQVYDKVIELGGSTTAEHADGRLRAGVLRRLYGDRIYEIFREIKKILDPEGILSPGVMLGERPFTDNIDFDKIKLYCAACGKCNGYCPAYDLFRREDYSPRGWLRILHQSGESRKNLDKYLSFCLNCKNCTIVCPAGVDIASEIMAYRAKKPSRLSRAVVTWTDNETLLNLSLRMGKLAEPIINSGPGKAAVSFMARPFTGIDKSIEFPAVAGIPLRKRFADRRADSGKLGLFHGCADNLLKSEFGEALFRVFDRLGIDLAIPEQKCCGLPQEVYGHRDSLIKKARFNIDRLNRFDRIITGCASCLQRLKEYGKLFNDNDPDREAALHLAARCFDISQYLNSRGIDFSIFNSGPDIRVTYHNPCHLRAAGLHREPERLIGKLAGVEIVHPLYGDRCCTQSGSYGYVHYRESKKMFRKKKDDYERLQADYIMTSCPSCQMKIRAELDGNSRVVHPVQILADRLRN